MAAHGVLLSLLVLAQPAGASPWQSAKELAEFVRSEYRDPRSASQAEKVLHDAKEAHPGDPSFAAVFGSWLFYQGRTGDAYPLLVWACRALKVESLCTAAAATDVAAGRWHEATDLAAVFPETACARSDRLWVLRYLKRDPKGAIERARGLLREEPLHEVSYLLLAAALHLNDEDKAATEQLRRGRQKASHVIVLKHVSWEAAK